MSQAKPHYKNGKGIGQSKAIDLDSIMVNNARPKIKPTQAKKAVVGEMIQRYKKKVNNYKQQIERKSG